MKTILRLFIIVGLTLGVFAVVARMKGQTPSINSPGTTSQRASRQHQKPLSGSGKVVRPLEGQVVDEAETAQLDAIFASASKAAAALPPGRNSGLQKRLLESDLDKQLATFVTGHSNSAWAPGVHSFLARRCIVRSGYTEAMDHFRQAWNSTRGKISHTNMTMAGEITGALAKLLVLTGRTEEYDALAKETDELKVSRFSTEWNWAKQVRRWISKHPDESYKCGLYCLDQLGRMTQNHEYVPKNILETDSSTNGFTAADLIRLGVKAGLHVHAAKFSDLSNPPVPSVLHLRSDHFVVVREKRGDFFNVYDPVAYGPRWLTGAEIAQEATGCAVVSDLAPLAAAKQMTILDATASTAYRGRCHFPLASDGQDGGGCTNAPDTCPPCPPGPGPGPSHGPGPGPSAGPGAGPGHGPGPGPFQRNAQTAPTTAAPGQGPAHTSGPAMCGSCGAVGDVSGMPTWSLSEPYLNLWVSDVPLKYSPAYGPPVSLRIAYSSANVPSTISGYQQHGSEVGGAGSGFFGLWSCSWFSYAELNASGDTVQLMMPGGGWAGYDFPSASSTSSINYMHNNWMEQISSGGGVTALKLHNPDGSTVTYSAYDNSFEPSFSLYYMSATSDAAGNSVTYSYDGSFYLTSVVAADGASFTLHYASTVGANFVSSITSSYGASVSFTYDPDDEGALYGITDTAGITSQFTYIEGDFGPITGLTTPYGTTLFDTWQSDFLDNGVFDRFARITNADNSIEFYGLINSYSGGDWPDFSAGQIPSGTPTGTLDADPGGRIERNTFHWNAAQFAPFITTSRDDFNWAAFKQARIKHWLADTAITYTHFNSLSLEQEPSPDGATEGQITWYDYTNKPTGVDYETGTQIMASDIAWVMPDGTTAYRHLDHTTSGLTTRMIEKWVDAGTSKFRTNTFVYAANGIDLIAITNAANIQVMSNIYNLYHQVTTNFDGLNQATYYTYDPTTLQLTSRKLPAGLTTTNIYDPTSHRMITNIDLEIARTNVYVWNADGTVHTRKDERGMLATYFWDGLHRLTGILYPDGTTVSNCYFRVDNTAYPNSTGNTNIMNLTATKDRLGYWTYMVYDPLQRLVMTTNANQVVTGYGYCECGAMTSLTNAMGNALQAVTQFVYDNQTRLVTTILPDGTKTTNFYDSVGRISIIGDAYGYSTNQFDNLGRVLSASNYAGRVESRIFDLIDRITNSINADGVRVTNLFDKLDRLLIRAYPDGGMEKFAYSARGLIIYTNQLGFTNLYAYDEAGRNILETNANSEVFEFTYSPARELLSMKDGKNQTTSWGYDIYGRMTNKIDANSATILTNTYDADSRLITRWTAAKGTTTYAYDAMGNMTNVSYPVSPSIHLKYDALNRITNMIDGIGTSRYTYDRTGQLLTEDGPWSDDTVTYSYNNGLRSAIVLQQANDDPWTQTYGYDGAKRLNQTASHAGTFNYLYDSVVKSRVGRLTLPNGALVTNTYDLMARLSTNSLQNSGYTDLDKYVYVYDYGNKINRVTRTDGDYVDYLYDYAGQLTNAAAKELGGVTNRLQEQFAYAYDKAHNLSVRTNNALIQTFNVDAVNQLTTVTRNSTAALTVSGTTTAQATGVTVTQTGGSPQTAVLYRDSTFAKDGFTPANGNNTFTANASDSKGRSSAESVTVFLPSSASYTYDNNGNLLNDGTRNFAYDDENELINVWVTNVWRSDFVYDGNLRCRLRKEYAWEYGQWIETNEVRYIYDQYLVIQERDTNNLATVTYTRGQDFSGTLQDGGGIGGLLARWDATTRRAAFYHADGNGNITMMLDSAQFIVARYIYDPFGNFLSISGRLANANSYRFSSKEFHRNSGLHYFLNRYYDSNLQRWLNRDPVMEFGGVNLFGYVFNCPVMIFDPFGLAGGTVLNYPPIGPPIDWGAPPDDGSSCSLNFDPTVTLNPNPTVCEFHPDRFPSPYNFPTFPPQPRRPILPGWISTSGSHPGIVLPHPFPTGTTILVKPTGGPLWNPLSWTGCNGYISMPLY